MEPSKAMPHTSAPARGKSRRARWLAARNAGALARRWNVLLTLLFTVSGTAFAQQSLILGKVGPLPSTVAEIYSPADGRVLAAREEPYAVGDAVKKGDPLAVIEHRYNLHDLSHMGTVRWELLSVMLDARRVATKARVDREKAERLLRLGSVSEREVQALRAAEQVAEAEFEKRRVLLEHQDAQVQGSEITRRGLFSTLDGEISYASFTQGQLITEGVLLYRIVDRREVGFAARFPEADNRPLGGKLTARIRFDGLSDKEYAGTLETVSPVVDPGSRTRAVLFRVKNPGLLLRYGMVGRLELAAP
jgi:multidrug efflux pump subunit AcrA (membrane-fusion protein)